MLDAAVPEQREQWVAILETWPDREVFADPEYVQLFCKAEERAVALFWDDQPGGILLPLVLRPLSVLPWTSSEDFWDATSPYGYGGPFSWGPKSTERSSFWAGFDDWAQQAGVVATFSRLCLFPGQIELPPEGVVEKQLNVVRSLDLDDEALMRDYAHKVRKNVRRAQRDGVRIVVDETGERLGTFLEIYNSTMARREADGGYYFGRDFFERIRDEMKGQYCFFHALLEGEVVSTELVLVSKQTLYSFLGGTLADSFAHRPNDLLKHEIIRWGRERGKSSFVLGGGYGGEDGIYKYKLAFAPNGAVPFSVMCRVHDPERYSRVIETRREWEQKQGKAWESAAAYFPAYRS